MLEWVHIGRGGKAMLTTYTYDSANRLKQANAGGVVTTYTGAKWIEGKMGSPHGSGKS